MPLKHNAKPKSKSYFGGGSDDDSDMDGGAGSDAGSDAGSVAGLDQDTDKGSDAGSDAGTDVGTDVGSDAGLDYDENDDFNAEEEGAAKKVKNAGVAAAALGEDLGEDAGDLDVEDLDEEDEDLDEDEDVEDEDEDQYAESDEEEGVKPTKLQGKKVKAVNVYSNEDDSEGAGDGDDDDDEDPDENYLQKFNSEINKNYITDFHPECIISNYDEVASLAVVVKDATGMIVDDLHRTVPYLSKYERARILGQRAKQINAGAPAFVKVPEKVIDGYLIAEMELANKTIPFIIRRPLPNGGSEYWRVNDLENIGF
jgi:DNA-directed RNA polymerase subunit K/omega